MSRETVLPLALVVAALSAIGGVVAWLDARRDAEAIAEHEARAAHRLDEERAESRELLQVVIDDVQLGMSLDEVRAVHRAMEPSSAHVDPGLVLYEEHRPDGTRLMVAFDDDRLVRVQALSQLDSTDMIPAHVGALSQRYGTPTGVWDCRDEGGITTRRFTWRRSHVGLADILLVYGGRVSVTLYVTTNEQMARSLQRARCTPVPAERIDELPTSSTDDIRHAAEEAEEEAHP